MISSYKTETGLEIKEKETLKHSPFIDTGRSISLISSNLIHCMSEHAMEKIVLRVLGIQV